MIGAGLGSFVLVGVLSTFLMLGRSGMNITSYTSMDAQTRRAIEEFAQDVRMSSAIVWNSDSSITLTVPDNYAANLNQVTYAWDDTPGSATYHLFFRRPGNTTSTAAFTPFVRNVTAFNFFRYDRLNAAATTDAGTKRVQISMKITTESRTVVTASDTTISASFVLRNKTAI